MAKKETTCSFCGRGRSQVGMLIAGLSGHICENCITQGYTIVQEEFNVQKTTASTKQPLTIHNKRAMMIWLLSIECRIKRVLKQSIPARI